MHVIGFPKLANRIAQIDPSAPTSQEHCGKTNKQLIYLDKESSQRPVLFLSLCAKKMGNSIESKKISDVRVQGNNAPAGEQSKDVIGSGRYSVRTEQEATTQLTQERAQSLERSGDSGYDEPPDRQPQPIARRSDEPEVSTSQPSQPFRLEFCLAALEKKLRDKIWKLKPPFSVAQLTLVLSLPCSFVLNFVRASAEQIVYWGSTTATWASDSSRSTRTVKATGTSQTRTYKQSSAIQFPSLPIHYLTLSF